MARRAPSEQAAAAVWRYREDVWRLARRLCRHREDAEDVAHSTLLRAVQHLDGFRGEASLRTWLHRIAANECRMLRRRQTPLSLDRVLEAGATAGGPGAALADTAPGPHELAEEAEARRSVLRALAGLPQHYRTAVLLVDGLGLPAGAVARSLGRSLPATRALLHRARRKLRERLVRS